MDRITKNSIGMDEYLDRLFDVHETTSNYPPYNLIQVNNVESHLRLLLLDLKRRKYMRTHSMENFLSKDRKADTETDKTFIHKGLAQRSL
jgi:molecular chaperone IbpA